MKSFFVTAVGIIYYDCCVDAFATSLLRRSSVSSSLPPKQLHMLLGPEKFDGTITNRINGKELGYNERTGRFFEVSATTANDAVVEDTVVINDMPPPMPQERSFEMMERSRRRTGQDRNDIDDAIGSLSDIPATKGTLADRIASAAAVSAAAMATTAVNAAVSMRTLSAPSVDKSYVSLNVSTDIDGDGLPLTYDKDLIEAYWRRERGALNERWSYFLGKAVPFLTRLVTLFISEGKIDERYVPELSRRARLDLQDLGPTFIKLGQMMSVRPDVLPQTTLDELQSLQDSVIGFDTSIAIQQIEDELGGPLGQFFSSISEEPVAAASLAQVYLATLASTGERVAVKVQRPAVLSTVSKDLYVLRRAAEVFQGLVERFAPQQRTNYVALLNEWAIGFYTELDFANEARNQKRLRDSLIDKGIQGITVPKVYEELCTRRVLVSEWMDGKKLSDCPPEEIMVVTAIAQEAFLTQLFELGFFHADPHPGNIMKLNNPTAEGHTVALLDCGLMATIDREDQDHMISAVIHLANKDYASLVDDFIRLNILPTDCDRASIIPLMDKALSPYVKGGGAKKYEEELKRLYGMEDDNMSSQVGGFQAMTQDALTVLNDIPFSIPPYFAILGRAIVTLEGIALTGNPNYGIIMESYPFIARKLLAEGRPEIQQALQEVLFSVTDSDSSSGLKLNRLLALLNNASGSIGTKEGAAFVDLDAVPKDGLSLADGFKLLLSDQSASLRGLLEDEVENIVDVFFRQITRKGMTEALVTFSPPRLPTLPFLGDIFSPPKLQLDDVPLPFLLPSSDGEQMTPSLSIMTVNEFTDLVAPKLSRDEEVYAISIADAAELFVGPDAAKFLRGDGIFSSQTATLVLDAATTGLLGNGTLLGTPAAQITLKVLSDLLRRMDGSSITGKYDVKEILVGATTKLSDDERKRMDEIVSELTSRILRRIRTRLGGKITPTR